MKPTLMVLAFPLVVFGVPVVLTSCKQEKQPSSAEARRPPVKVVIVEVRNDGLAYLPGAVTPFTGEAVSAYPDEPWRAQTREPFTDGKRDGDKQEFFRNGKTKTLRRYEKGVPKYAAAYHRNGQLKFELNLNAQDKGEGPYKRWYADGTVESTATFDAEERWHGELKEWDPAGNLKTHHVLEHGVLREIIFESPESRKVRESGPLKLVPREPAAPAAPEKVADPQE